MEAPERLRNSAKPGSPDHTTRDAQDKSATLRLRNFDGSHLFADK